MILTSVGWQLTLHMACEFPVAVWQFMRTAIDLPGAKSLQPADVLHALTFVGGNTAVFFKIMYLTYWQEYTFSENIRNLNIIPFQCQF